MYVNKMEVIAMANQASQNGSSTYVIGSAADISEDSPLVTEVDGNSVAVFYQDDEYYALNNTCPHQGGPLGDGKVDDGCVHCPWHGWQFDLETGEHVHGTDEAEKYPVTVDDGEVRIEL